MLKINILSHSFSKIVYSENISKKINIYIMEGRQFLIYKTGIKTSLQINYITT